MDLAFIIYMLGWIIWAGVLIDELSIRDIMASVIVGAVWPISAPIKILRTVFN